MLQSGSLSSNAPEAFPVRHGMRLLHLAVMQAAMAVQLRLLTWVLLERRRRPEGLGDLVERHGGNWLLEAAEDKNASSQVHSVRLFVSVDTYAICKNSLLHLVRKMAC